MAAFPESKSIRKENTTLTIRCDSCIYKSETAPTFIFMDGETVHKVLLYQKNSEKLGKSIRLHDDDGHPAYVETVLSKITNIFSNDTPHLANVKKIMRYNNIDHLKVNSGGKEISTYTSDYYKYVSIISCDKAEMNLEEYLDNNQIEDEEIFGIIFQVFYSLYILGMYLPNFIHGDLKLSNILMMKNTDYAADKYTKYIVNGKDYYVKSRPLIPVVWDYEFSTYSNCDNNLATNVLKDQGVANDIYRFFWSFFAETQPEKKVGNAPKITSYGSYHLGSGYSYNSYKQAPTVPDTVEKDVVPNERYAKYVNISNKFGYTDIKVFQHFWLQHTNLDKIKHIGDMFDILHGELNKIPGNIGTTYQFTHVLQDDNTNIYHLLNTYTNYKISDNIRALVFDFDETLINKHSNNPLSYDPRYLMKHIDESTHTSDLINNCENMKTVFAILKGKGTNIAVASFGISKYISEYVNELFPGVFNDVITTDNISTEYGVIDALKNGQYLLDETCERRRSFSYGKNKMLKVLKEKYNVEFGQMMYFDDDDNNIKCAKKNDEFKDVYSYNNSKSGVYPGLIWSVMIESSLNQDIVQLGGHKAYSHKNYAHKYQKYKYKYMKMKN